MQLALARHDAVLRAAIETNGGVVFKRVGDAFCAVLTTVVQGHEAAASGQQSLHSEEREVAEVKSLRSTKRLLTLAGSGGCEKMRLALQVAADVLEDLARGCLAGRDGSFSRCNSYPLGDGEGNEYLKSAG
jgi:hypothetical protein